MFCFPPSGCKERDKNRKLIIISGALTRERNWNNWLFFYHQNEKFIYVHYRIQPQLSHGCWKFKKIDLILGRYGDTLISMVWPLAGWTVDYKVFNMSCPDSCCFCWKNWLNCWFAGFSLYNNLGMSHEYKSSQVNPKQLFHFLFSHGFTETYVTAIARAPVST